MEKATSVPKKTKAAEKLDEKIFSAYMEYVLTHGKEPASVFQFTKELGVKEADFYQHFASFQAVESALWQDFHHETVQKITTEKVYKDYAAREKMLAYYFTLIEVLKQRRSYVMYSWQGVKKTDLSPRFLKHFKQSFHEFVNQLIGEASTTEEVMERPYISSRYADGIWIQFLFVLNFWVKDDSKGFERTDAAIEKAVNLSFDLMGKSTLDTMFDFVKFIYQNR